MKICNIHSRMQVRNVQMPAQRLPAVHCLRFWVKKNEQNEWATQTTPTNASTNEWTRSQVQIAQLLRACNHWLICLQGPSHHSLRVTLSVHQAKDQIPYISICLEHTFLVLFVVVGFYFVYCALQCKWIVTECSQCHTIFIYSLKFQCCAMFTVQCLQCNKEKNNKRQRGDGQRV